MARYSLVAKLPDGHEKLIVPFGKNNKGDNITKVDLEEIDLFTTSFSNFYELEIFLKQKYEIPFYHCHFEIQYIYNGNIRKMDVLVNNPFLKQCAKYCLQRKESTKKGILTEEINDFSTFLKRIFHYMKTKDSFAVLSVDSTGLVPFEIKKVLNRFHILSNLTYHSLSEKQELIDIKENLIYVLSHYKNMRRMLRWEQLYLSGKLQKKKKDILNKPSNPIPYLEKKTFWEEENEEDDYDEYAFLEEEEKEQMVGYQKEATYRSYK